MRSGQVSVSGQMSSMPPLRQASPGARKAFLTLALVEPYLTVLAIADQRSLLEIADISPMNRFCRLAWAAVSGRI